MKLQSTIITLLIGLSIFGAACSKGGGNTNNTANQSSAGDSSSPTTSGTPTGTPQPFPNALTGDNSWLQNARVVKDRIGQQFTYTCPPGVKIMHRVYNNGDVYYTASPVCSAAIHAGVITQAQGGQVTIEIRSRPSSGFTANERNGVKSAPITLDDQEGGYVFARQ